MVLLTSPPKVCYYLLVFAFVVVFGVFVITFIRTNMTDVVAKPDSLHYG